MLVMRTELGAGKGGSLDACLVLEMWALERQIQVIRST